MSGSGGGLGSVLHMINTLKNNRNLLRKATRFRGKNNIYNKTSEMGESGMKGELHFKAASREAMEHVHMIMENDKKINRKRTVIITITVSLTAILGGYALITGLHKQQQKYNRQQQIIAEHKKKEAEKEAEKQKQENRGKYEFYISDGDNWLTRKNYYTAIYQYKNALALFPESYLAASRLANAYYLDCINKQENCSNAETLINRLIKQNPDKSELYELRINYKVYKGDTSGTFADRSAIEKLSHNNN